MLKFEFVEDCKNFRASAAGLAFALFLLVFLKEFEY